MTLRFIKEADALREQIHYATYGLYAISKSRESRIGQEDLGYHICCKRLIRSRLFQRNRFYKHTRHCVLKPECRTYIGQVQRRVVEQLQRLQKNQEDSLSRYINSLFKDTLQTNKFSKRTLRIVDNARRIQQTKMGNSRLQKKWVNLHNNGKKNYAEILRGIRISSYKKPSLTQTKHNLTLNKSRQQLNNLPGDTSFQHEFNVQVETSPKCQLNDHNESQGEESKETTWAPYRLTKDSSLYDKEIAQIIQESNSLRSKIQAIIETLKSKNKWTEHHEQWRNEITSFFSQSFLMNGAS
ncbi:hypothetical protein OXYTRIMIC_742 [Oxytricha trifallax]|uniref:Uncharacterized protein n=1 Tax=Oxytricha trifallax TaxID=1172189 RepID=A0A073IBV9_9SPIT|nr:hypothetical protein OXYTRIMIC_742 [Oxytricha trifallax]